MRATLAGVKAVTLSAPGVLLEEWDAAALQVCAGLPAQRVLLGPRELGWCAACSAAGGVPKPKSLCKKRHSSPSCSTLACAGGCLPSDCAGVVKGGARRSACYMVMPDVFVIGCVGVSQDGAILRPEAAKVVREVPCVMEC